MHQKLYVGNLPWRTSEKEFRELFRNYGPIHSIFLVTDQETQMSCGFGFVELEEPYAEAAMRDLDESIFLGRVLRIRKAFGRDTECEKPPASHNSFGCKSFRGWGCGGRGCENRSFWDMKCCMKRSCRRDNEPYYREPERDSRDSRDSGDFEVRERSNKYKSYNKPIEEDGWGRK
jgi:RNA recognition motif-containing protein